MDKLMLGYDCSDKKIFEIINECFDKNYAGWMQAWYDINDEFAAWFPTITQTDDCPNGSYGGTQRCSNTLWAYNTTIVEINHEQTQEQAIRDLDNPKMKKFNKTRLVFGRVDGSFVFLGVFERDILFEEKHAPAIHHRVARGVDLKTWELIK
jgi:hypothetical protein